MASQPAQQAPASSGQSCPNVRGTGPRHAVQTLERAEILARTLRMFQAKYAKQAPRIPLPQVNNHNSFGLFGLHQIIFGKYSHDSPPYAFNESIFFIHCTQNGRLLNVSSMLHTPGQNFPGVQRRKDPNYSYPCVNNYRFQNSTAQSVGMNPGIAPSGP